MLWNLQTLSKAWVWATIHNFEVQNSQNSMKLNIKCRWDANQQITYVFLKSQLFLICQVRRTSGVKVLKASTHRYISFDRTTPSWSDQPKPYSNSHRVNQGNPNLGLERSRLSKTMENTLKQDRWDSMRSIFCEPKVQKKKGKKPFLGVTLFIKVSQRRKVTRYDFRSCKLNAMYYNQ